VCPSDPAPSYSVFASEGPISHWVDNVEPFELVPQAKQSRIVCQQGRYAISFQSRYDSRTSPTDPDTAELLQEFVRSLYVLRPQGRDGGSVDLEKFVGVLSRSE
jgi:hypothetical protein